MVVLSDRERKPVGEFPCIWLAHVPPTRSPISAEHPYVNATELPAGSYVTQRLRAAEEQRRRDEQRRHNRT